MSTLPVFCLVRNFLQAFIIYIFVMKKTKVELCRSLNDFSFFQMDYSTELSIERQNGALTTVEKNLTAY